MYSLANVKDEDMKIEVGDVYTYLLKHSIGRVVKACKRPFIIVEINDDSVIGVPFTSRLGEFTDTRRVYSSLTVNGISKEICVLTDVPVKIAKNELISKIAAVEGELLRKIQNKAEGNTVFSDVISVNDGGIRPHNNYINIKDEVELSLFFDSITADEEGKNLNLETDSHYIISSNSVILDRKDAKLFIPIELNGVAYGQLMISFVNNPDEEKDIKKIPHSDNLELMCVNFDELQENFTVELLQVATLNDKKISMHILSSLKGEKEKIRVVQYTIFWEK